MTPGEARRVLGLRPDERDPDQLRRAYRHAVRRHHPDRPDGDPARFRRSVIAFELLTVGLEQGPAPAPPGSGARPTPAEPPAGSGTGLGLLMVGLDRVGEVTYLDRSLALVGGVLPHPTGALQVLIVGTVDGTAEVVDVTRFDGGVAPPIDEIRRLLAAAGGEPGAPGA